MSIRGRVDDVRRVRVRAYALWRDAYARACVPSRLRQAHVDDEGHRANARACALLLRAYVHVCVPSLLSLLLLVLKIVKDGHYTLLVFVMTITWSGARLNIRVKPPAPGTVS